MTKRVLRYLERKSFNKRYYVPIHLLDTPNKKKIYLAKKANEFLSSQTKINEILANLSERYFDDNDKALF